MSTEKKIDDLCRAARHYRRTVMRHRRIVYGPVAGLDPAVKRVTKQLRDAERNLMFRAECYAHASEKDE